MTWWILSYTSVIFFWNCDELLHCGLTLLFNMKLQECLQLQDETHHLKGTLCFVFHVACKESWNCDQLEKASTERIHRFFFAPEKLLFWIPRAGRGTEQSYGGRDQPGRLGFRGWHLMTFLLIHEVKLPTLSNQSKWFYIILCQHIAGSWHQFPMFCTHLFMESFHILTLGFPRLNSSLLRGRGDWTEQEWQDWQSTGSPLDASCVRLLIKPGVKAGSRWHHRDESWNWWIWGMAQMSCIAKWTSLLSFFGKIKVAFQEMIPAIWNHVIRHDLTGVVGPSPNAMAVCRVGGRDIPRSEAKLERVRWRWRLSRPWLRIRPVE